MMKEDLILELYKNIWDGARKKEQITVQYLSIIVSAVGLVAVTFACEPEYLNIATFVAQIILTWGMLLALEAGYEYRRYQTLSSLIEKRFNKLPVGCVNICGCGGVIPPSYHNVLKDKPFDLPNVYKIHIVTMWVIFILLTFFCLYQKNPNLVEELSKIRFGSIAITGSSFVGLIIFLCRNEGRRKRTKKNLEEIIEKLGINNDE